MIYYVAMTVERPSLVSLLRAAALPSGCIAVMAYFAFHAVSGNTGLLAWQTYRSERVAVEKDAARVAAMKTAVAREVALLDPHHVDPDYADELVRRNLGVVRPDEVIIPLPESGSSKQ